MLNTNLANNWACRALLFYSLWRRWVLRFEGAESKRKQSGLAKEGTARKKEPRGSTWLKGSGIGRACPPYPLSFDLSSFLSVTRHLVFLRSINLARMNNHWLCVSSRIVWFLLILILLHFTVISAIEVPIFPNDSLWVSKAMNITAGDVLLFNEGNPEMCFRSPS